MFVLIVVFIGNAHAPDIQKIKVCVVISDADKEDKAEKDIIESHLKRELRALGNVIIVDEKDDWQFRLLISIFVIKYKDGTKTPNVSIAESLNKRVPKFYFKTYEFDSPNIPVYDFAPSAGYWYRDDLPNFCIIVANRFDKFLKVSR